MIVLISICVRRMFRRVIIVASFFWTDWLAVMIRELVCLSAVMATLFIALEEEGLRVFFFLFFSFSEISVSIFIRFVVLVYFR